MINIKDITKHFPHYFPLIGIFIAGILGFIYFSYDKYFQAVLIISIAIFYVGWGIIHHKIHKDLYWEVVVEYLAVAILGLVIGLSLIFSL